MEAALISNINFKSVMKFTIPTIIMMVFMAIYQMVDGVFISNIIGTDALSAVNIVFPVISLLIGVSIMLGTGGSAVIATNLGEGRITEAKQRFTFIVVVGAAVGVVSGILGFSLAGPLSNVLGSTPALYDYCVDYISVLSLAAPFAVLQMLFTCFFPAAGKPKLGLAVVVAGGVANVILDWLFMAVLGLGIKGAAVATGIGYAIPAVFGVVYFAVKRDGLLCFEKPKAEFKVLLSACFNGSSEMVTNLANGVTTFLFNLMMMKIVGEDGVAAITVALYAQFLLTAVYMGYSGGIAPVISYNYGRQDTAALKKTIKISLISIVLNSILWFFLSIVLEDAITGIFVRDGNEVKRIIDEGWKIFTLTFLLVGFNIFASSMFTAFSNGLISALISFLRTFGFLSACILLLPIIAGVKGIWLSVPLAEALTLCISVLCFIIYRKKYEYI